MEYWDIYDQYRIKKEKQIKRGAPLQTGEYHLVVHVCIFNSKGEMLIQQRQPFKKNWSNLWDISVGGCALAGETSEKAAQRELFEELGIHWDFTKERPYMTTHFVHGFDDYYLLTQDIDLQNLKLQTAEVKDAKWARKREILDLIEKNHFIPYHPSLIQLLFDMQKERGSIRRIKFD